MIFLDAASTTRPYKEVIETISDVAYNNWYNPSASYSVGHDTMMLIEDTRSFIAEDINCNPDEIIFTSSACESNSLAILSILNNHTNIDFFTTRLEHTSINEIIKDLNCSVGYFAQPFNDAIDINFSLKYNALSSSRYFCLTPTIEV